MNAVATEKSLNPFDSPIVAAPTGASAGALAQRDSNEATAAMMIARRFPRDQRVAMDRILMSCTRPTLADEGLYEYARGGTTITGPSIRLAEEMARQWGNMTCGVAELSRFGGQSEVMAYAVDLETGFRDEKRFMVKHWRDTRAGGHVITDERDIYEHLANMGARRKRACILAVIPVDVQEAAVKQCELTLVQGMGEVTADNIKKVVERFAKFGVTKEMIEKNIQRRIDSITPLLYSRLGKIYTSIKDEMSVPGDWFEMPAAAAIEGAQAGVPKTVSESVKDKLRSGAAPAAAAQQAQPTPAAATTAQVDIKSAEPYYSKASAIDAIKTADSDTALQALWKAITADYRDSNRELPVEVEGAYNDRSEALESNL